MFGRRRDDGGIRSALSPISAYGHRRAGSLGQDRFDGLEQFAGLERFVDDDIGAEGRRERRGVGKRRVRRATGYHHNWDVIAGAPNFLKQGDAVHVRHPYIAGNGIELAGLEQFMDQRADEQAEAMRVYRDDANELRRQTLELQRERIAEQRGNSPYTPSQQRRIDALSRQFDNQPAVKTVQTMWEALSFVESLNPKTSRSTDDQALIYAFAKVMDPESVVREGEYATVQRYAQSWAQQLGFDARRIFDNSPFLSEEARANIKNTIRSRFASRKSMYDTVRSETIRKINRITGNEDGADELIDYLPTPNASTMIEAIDPSGNIHHAPAGTPLPTGWRLKQ